MAHHVVELALWLLLAFIAGAIVGCLVRRAFATGGPRHTDDRITGPALSEGYAGEGVMAARAAVAREKAARAEEAARKRAQEAVAGAAAATAAETAETSTEKTAQDTTAAEPVESADQEDVKEKEETSAEDSAAETADEATEKATGQESAAEMQGLMAAQPKDGGKPTAEEKEAAKKDIDESQGAGDTTAAAASGKDDAAKFEVPVVGLKEPVAGEPDNLQMISGIGPKLEKLLHDLGIYYFAQIARWDEKTIAEVDDKLQFKGRIQRDEWVRQAQLLAEGKLEEFERDYGTGGMKDASGKTRSGARTRKKK